VLVSLRRDVGVIGTQYRCCWDKVSVSSRRGVGARPCRQDAMLVLGCGVGVVRT